MCLEERKAFVAHSCSAFFSRRCGLVGPKLHGEVGEALIDGFNFDGALLTERFAGTLVGGTVTSPDIRAGIALVIAALCAKGETVILNAESIDRGYVAVEESLGALGANIVRTA